MWQEGWRKIKVSPFCPHGDGLLAREGRPAGKKLEKSNSVGSSALVACAGDLKYGGNSEKGKKAPGWLRRSGKTLLQEQVLRPRVRKAGTVGQSGGSCWALKMVVRGFLPSPLCYCKMGSDSLLSSCFLPVDTVLEMLLVSGFPVVLFPGLFSGTY